MNYCITFSFVLLSLLALSEARAGSADTTSAAIRIVSISGQLVLALDLVQNHSTIDLTGLSPGMYFAQITSGD